MDNKPDVFLHHMLDAIALIEEFVIGFDYDQFSNDERTKSAIIRQLEIVGEAGRRLESEFKKKYPNIPWKQINGLRNILAHEYWDIDDRIVWKAATQSVLELKMGIELIIEDLK